MSTKGLTALLGIHDEGVLETWTAILQYNGYSVTQAPTPEEIIRLAECNQHYAYIMDLNLGKPRSSDITSSVNVYNIVRGRVDAGEARFVGISGNPDVVDIAKKHGVPAFYKTDFDMFKSAEQA